jgi:hypothetical protein
MRGAIRPARHGAQAQRSMRLRAAGSALAGRALRLSQRCARELGDFVPDPPPLACAGMRGCQVAENIKRWQPVEVGGGDRCAIAALPAQVVERFRDRAERRLALIGCCRVEEHEQRRLGIEPVSVRNEAVWNAPGVVDT